MVSKLFDTNYVNCEHVWAVVTDPNFPLGAPKSVCSKCGMSPAQLVNAPTSAPVDRIANTQLSIEIPPALAGYENDIRRFIDAMIYKLEKNAHKGKWEGLSVDGAFKLLQGEVEELRAEIGGNAVKTLLEAADVANFALVIANIATERGK